MQDPCTIVKTNRSVKLERRNQNKPLWSTSCILQWARTMGTGTNTQSAMTDDIHNLFCRIWSLNDSKFGLCCLLCSTVVYVSRYSSTYRRKTCLHVHDKTPVTWRRWRWIPPKLGSYLSNGTEPHFSTFKRNATSSSETSVQINRNIRTLPLKTGPTARRKSRNYFFSVQVLVN